jgi:hypothetical protein
MIYRMIHSQGMRQLKLSRDNLPLWTPILIGAILRIFIVWFNPHTPIWDEVSFEALAQKLVLGQPYGAPFWPPGWPYTITLLYRLFGTTNPGVMTWFNCAASILLLLFMAVVTLRLFTRQAAVVSVWLMAFMPSYLLINGLMVYEVLYQLLLVIGIFLAVGVAWTWPRVVGITLVCAFITLIRPTWFLLPLILWCMNLIYGCKTQLKWPLLAEIGVLVLIIPWILMISSQVGRFVPIAMQGGLHLWMANNPLATGDHIAPPPEFWDPLNEPQARAIALQYIRDHPTHLLTILPAKIWHMFRMEPFIVWFFQQTRMPIPTALSNAVKLIANTYYFVILLLAGIGVGGLIAQKKYRFLGPLFLLVCGVVLQIAVFTGQSKYRWPMQFVIIMYASLTITWLLAAAARKYSTRQTQNPPPYNRD